MCLPLVAVAAIGVAVSVAATAFSAVAANTAAKGKAEQYEIQRTETKVAAMQGANDRFEEFSELESANQASIAATGFSAGSFQQLTDANRENAQQDMRRIEAGGRIADNRLGFQADDAKAAGKAALIGGLGKAAGTGLSGAVTVGSMV